MIFYLTYNDVPSGIYSSQVLDVVKYMREELHSEVKLVALISMRRFWKNRQKIKQEAVGTIVLPMFPGLRFWKMNGVSLWILCVFKKPKTVIARSVLATQLALWLRDKGRTERVVYDGRGAIAAEWREYGVVKNTFLLSQVGALEKTAVNKSDFRISVSHKLIDYWEKEFEYKRGNDAVIPCTLHSLWEKNELSLSVRKKMRAQLAYADTDVVLVYSGSSAGWQSFHTLVSYSEKFLSNGANCKVLFLCDATPQIETLSRKFPSQVHVRKVRHVEIQNYLQACDAGLLIREPSVTNQVASPVKFAEYLASGLPVIVSGVIGDYAEFVLKHHCGLVGEAAGIEKIVGVRGGEMRELCMKYLTKSAYRNQYMKVLGQNVPDEFENRKVA